jgi:anti-sigma B factor antagonist
MAFEIREREHEDILILELDGRLTAGEPCVLLRDTVNAAIAKGRSRIVLDMARVPYIDSSGLGTLVGCHTSLDRAGGALRILNLTSRGIELLVLTKLTTVFELFDDEQNAVNSFFPDREIRHFDILSFVEQRKQERPR